MRGPERLPGPHFVKVALAINFCFVQAWVFVVCNGAHATGSGRSVSLLLLLNAGCTKHVWAY